MATKAVAKQKLPALTNLDVEKFPFEDVLPTIAKAAKTEVALKSAVTGATAKKGWDQTANYLGALRALGILQAGNVGLTPLGLELAKLAATSKSAMLIKLREHLMLHTTLGIVVHVLLYTAPHAAGDRLIVECARTLEVAFDVDVATRKQQFGFTFRFLRWAGLLDAHNMPVHAAVKAALGLDPDPFMKQLAALGSDESIVLLELLTLTAKGKVKGEELKERIRIKTGEIIEVGKGAAGIGKRLEKKGFIKLTGGVGKGARDTELALKSATIKAFLGSPLAQAYILRANFESGGLLANLEKVVGTPIKKLVAELKKKPEDGILLEVVAARLAFLLGCSDITIRSRQIMPEVEAEGEKDVLATFPRPFPFRVLIQCKAHKAPMGTAVLYREVAIALLSTSVRTILMFSTGGYQNSTLMMQRACMRAFPSLTIALFDGADIDKIGLNETEATRVIYDRLNEIAAQQRRLEESLSPRQLRLVKKVLVDLGAGAKLMKSAIDQLWKPDWDIA